MTRNHLQMQAERMSEELAIKRGELAKNPTDRVLELEIEALEQRRDATQLQANHLRTLAADREEAARKREENARAELEARLMSDYVKASPGTTEAEARAMLPDLLHRHRIAELDRNAQALAVAKSRIRI